MSVACSGQMGSEQPPRTPQGSLQFFPIEGGELQLFEHRSMKHPQTILRFVVYDSEVGGTQKQQRRRPRAPFDEHRKLVSVGEIVNHSAGLLRQQKICIEGPERTLIGCEHKFRNINKGR